MPSCSSSSSPSQQEVITPLGAQLLSLLAGAASAGPPSSRLIGSWRAADAFSTEAQKLPPVPPLDLRGSGSLAGTTSSRVSAQTEALLHLLACSIRLTCDPAVI